ncbi:MAG: hypothetical protein R3B72_52395 [Polyangiaceae bacterium]
MSLTVEVDPGVLRAVGHYRLAVRHDGLLWMPSHTSATAWQRARSLWALFGDRDRPWPEVPVGYFPRALVCSNFAARGDGDPPFGPDRCEELFMLIPRRSSPGPDMLIVTALIQWPDARADPGTWKRLVFATPLPAGTSLAERITAALGTTPHPLAAVGPEIYE